MLRCFNEVFDDSAAMPTPTAATAKAAPAKIALEVPASVAATCKQVC